MDAGQLVPDDLIIGMVRTELEAASAIRFLLDGFPRTSAQAAALDALLADLGAKVTAAVALEVDDDELVRRMLQRSVQEGRSDDNEATIRTRMGVYHEQTKPLLDYYGGQAKLRRVDGVGGVDEVTDRIRAVLPALDAAGAHEGAA